MLCLYTDGLVERRGIVIDDNIEKLRRTVTAQAPESVCIDVMQQLVGPATPEDDVAVLVARDLATAQPTTSRIMREVGSASTMRLPASPVAGIPSQGRRNYTDSPEFASAYPAFRGVWFS